MASSTRYLLLVLLAVAFCVGRPICCDALAAVARPPTVVARNAPSPPDKNLPDYIPPTYTLGAPLNDPKSFDVDEFGRMYVLDVGRSAVLIFGPDGKLESMWRDGDFVASNPVVRLGIHVVASDLIFISGQGWEMACESVDSTLRISPRDKDGVTVLPSTQRYGRILGRPDGGYYELYSHDQIEIRFHNPDGRIIATTTLGSPNDYYFAPAGIDGEGNYYLFEPGWKSSKPSAIHVWNSGGEKIRDVELQPLASGPPPQVWPQSLRAAAVDANGDIYASDGSWILRFDSFGREISRCAAWADPREHPRERGFKPPVSVMTVRNGIIYASAGGEGASSSRSGEIQAFTASGRCIARYRIPKTRFNCPTALAVQPNGNFAVSQYGIKNGEACILMKPDGLRIATLPFGTERLQTLPDGSYFGLGLFSCATIIDQSGTPLRKSDCGSVPLFPCFEDCRVGSMCAYPPENGLLVNTLSPVNPPGGVYPDPEMYVLDRDGKVLRKFPSYYSRPNGMSADKLGNIYMAIGDVFGQSEFVKFDSQGKQLAKLDRKGWRLGELVWPAAVLIDDADNLLVLDSGNSRIQVFNTNLEPLGVWGKLGGGDGELDHPRDMCFGPKNTLWIADTRNDRIVWIPLEKLWRELTREASPPRQPIMAAKREPLPANGRVALNGVITSDSRDGVVYAQHSTGSWGVRLQLPKGLSVARGKSYEIVGNLVAKSGDNLLTAKSLTPIKKTAKTRPIGLANSFLAKPGKNPTVQSGVLVATWGQVISTDKAARAFTVSDGSMGSGGVNVSCGNRVKGTMPVKVGEYVALTGIAVRSGAGHGVQIRESADIRDLGAVNPKPSAVAQAMAEWR